MGRSSFATKLHHFRELLIFLCVLFAAQKEPVFASDSDKSALLELKSSLLDPYGVVSTWKPSDPSHCNWTGVSCGPGNRVVGLSIVGGGNSLSCVRIAQFPLYGFGIRRNCLGGNNFRVLGKLSAAVAKLTEIRNLSMPFNELSGEIPLEIWGMEKLEILDLEGNFLSGKIPNRFTGLRSLKVLNLGFNQISGVIPISLLNCMNLQVVNLAGNQVNGTIPSFIGSFHGLTGIHLSFNRLTGPIPVEIGDNCQNLEHLELSGNYITDGIPKTLTNCRGLKTILLYSNLLEGEIPGEIGQLNELEVLDVSFNSFGGGVPAALSNCTKLSVLVLSNSWNPLPNVSEHNLTFTTDEYNFYEGSIPAGITALSSLRLLWAPRATLSGDFPTGWGSCEELEMLNLASNFMSGAISDGLNNCTKLRFLDLSSNRLNGMISNKIRVPCMTLFDVSGNSLSGALPSFNYEACAPLSPDLANSYDHSSVYIKYFGYRSQMIASSLFYGLGGGSLVMHNFGSNNITGGLVSMPVATERLGKQTVYAFLAGGNKLAGSLPRAFFWKCDQAGGVVVNVTNNLMSGEVPPDIAMTCSALMLLDVSRNQITGRVPVGFRSLVSLNLNGNSLQGLIPRELGEVKTLTHLSLAGNRLNGSIPASLGQLRSLEVLDLSMNSLSGSIPLDFANLRSLKVLLLNNNLLSGQLPPSLANIATLSTFNASFNDLSGPALPQNNSIFGCDSYLGNPSLSCVKRPSSSPPDQQGRLGNSLDESPPPQSATGEKKGDGGFDTIAIASVTCSAIIVSVLIALIVLYFYTRKWKPRSRVSVGTVRKEVIVFTDIGVPLTFENVVRATGSFNASNCIGSGGFGATYKAEISPGVLVAIKRLAIGRFQGVQQFDAEIRTLARLRHRNLVTLIGYHASETEMFLIYNYLPGGNLEKFIQERPSRAVDWRVLHKIALDISHALAYLHDQCVPRVLHRDVKPSNILLDDDYNAYLSDFGLARLLGTSETHATTGVAGTFGYVAPEYAMTCRVSDKADVYSYGVVLLELLSDKKALDPSFSLYGNGFNIVAWACMLLRQGRAKEFFTAGLWDAGPHDDLVEVLHLAVVCTVETLSNRPTMKLVVRRLKQLQPPSC